MAITYSNSKAPGILLAFANDDGRSPHQLDERLAGKVGGVEVPISPRLSE